MHIRTYDRTTALISASRRIFGCVVAGVLILLTGMALQQPTRAADEPASSKRFRVMDNGTVTDQATGLIWLQQVDALGTKDWQEAVAAGASLSAGDVESLKDRSKASDWRLPTAHELSTLTKAGLIGGRLPDDHPFVGLTPKGKSRLFWTQTEGFYDSTKAFRVNFRGKGDIAVADKSEAYAVWPVKGRSKRLPVHEGRISDLAATFAHLKPSDQQRAEINALFDIKGLRLKRDFVTMRTKAFLDVPAGFPGYRPLSDFTLAKQPSEFSIQILPDMLPQYFPPGEAYQGGWANWAAVTRSADDRFIMAVGDHRGKGAQVNIYNFKLGDGKPGRLERLFNLSEVLGWTPDTYTDGKIHGHMDIMPDGTVWGATHRGYGVPMSDEWFKGGYRGSWLFSFNINTGKAVNWGVPMIDFSMPNFRTDTQRGIFFANGEASEVFCWDVKTHRVLYAGSPPNGWHWDSRGTFLDPATGYFWSEETSEEPYRYISYDPERNRFKRYDVTVPLYPGSKKQHPHGAWAAGPDREGRYYTDNGGVFIRFRPDWEKGPEIEVLGQSAREGEFPVLQMIMSPDQRFVYWVPRGTDTMIVNQYEIATGKLKILGFFEAAVREKYGLSFGNGVWGMNISTDGSHLVILDNGGFGKRFWGHPVLFVISIPASER